MNKKPTIATVTELLEQRLAHSVDEAATGLSRDLLYDQMRTGAPRRSAPSRI